MKEVKSDLFRLWRIDGDLKTPLTSLCPVEYCIKIREEDINFLKTVNPHKKVSYEVERFRKYSDGSHEWEVFYV